MSALARALERLGHSVRVYTPNPVVGAPSERVEVDGIRVTRVRSLPVPLYGQYRWALFPLPQLRGERFAQDVDVVHLHTPGVMGGTGFLAARHFHKPLVGTFHTNVSQMRGSFRRDPLVGAFFRAAWWFTLGTYYRCDVTTAPTDAARQSLIEGGTKPFRRPIEVIPNGIEVDRFRPGIRQPDWRARCGLPDVPLVTYLGRLTLDKGVHRFLDAVAALSDRKDFAAVVGGTGPEEAAVRERLRSEARLTDRVRYLGSIAEEEKPSLLAQSDLFVLPSTSDTSSLALLEAMASGAACVVSNVGGPGEMVEDGVTARRFDPVSTPSLPQVLAELLDAPRERHDIARRAVAYVDANASIDQTARRFISLYELLLSERRAHGVHDAG